jgi:hypothetical protein
MENRGMFEGVFAVTGELQSESESDAEAVKAVADELSELNPPWDVQVVERGTSNMPLVSISWVWESEHESASAEQAMAIFAKVFNGLYHGLPMPHIRWSSRPTK